MTHSLPPRRSSDLPETFAGSPIESEYKRLSPNPKKFGAMIEKVKALDARPFGWSDEDVQRIPGKTMVIVGDADGVTLDHAIALFKLRGGGDVGAATQDRKSTRLNSSH